MAQGAPRDVRIGHDLQRFVEPFAARGDGHRADLVGSRRRVGRRRHGKGDRGLPALSRQQERLRHRHRPARGKFEAHFAGGRVLHPVGERHGDRPGLPGVQRPHDHSAVEPYAHLRHHHQPVTALAEGGITPAIRHLALQHGAVHERGHRRQERGWRRGGSIRGRCPSGTGSHPGAAAGNTAQSWRWPGSAPCRSRSPSGREARRRPWAGGPGDAGETEPRPHRRLARVPQGEDHLHRLTDDDIGGVRDGVQHQAVGIGEGNTQETPLVFPSGPPDAGGARGSQSAVDARQPPLQRRTRDERGGSVVSMPAKSASVPLAVRSSTSVTRVQAGPGVWSTPMSCDRCRLRLAIAIWW